MSCPVASLGVLSIPPRIPSLEGASSFVLLPYLGDTCRTLFVSEMGESEESAITCLAYIDKTDLPSGLRNEDFTAFPSKEGSNSAVMSKRVDKNCKEGTACYV